ncbi:hypothetical protein FVEN_g1952 [Fusarium venenatum]|uniref:DUF7703 domain-containing protein n=1 Tax=Fusarium venenatum TaxID=56646 RepID=A0A2L2T6R9_9HYPO|nr:uncharacterized protein FVRRES_12359 [Fusarium venenatum]KAG8360488.1 hypothetical protein FVEN_g1952 [Fusarium venenatum]CEI39668.1 unnamed protein product [Fusarium venenatum]
MGYSGREDHHELSYLLPIAVCMGISLYNVLELNLVILTTFKTRKSLYFWSFIAATNGIAPHTIGFLLKNLCSSDNFILYISLISVGWVMMITGQSLVLYSRLHLIFWNQFYLRLVLAMIITNVVVMHIPIIILMYGANSSASNSWVHPYQIYEKIQVTVFFSQELIISALYIKACFSFFSTEELLHGKGVQRMRRHLLIVNVVIILLDIPILVLEFADFYDFQTAYKTIVYSIKLKLEFHLLNRLVEVAKGNEGIDLQRGNQTLHGLRLEAFESDGDFSRSNDYEHGNMNKVVGYQINKRKYLGSENDILTTTDISVSYIERRDDNNESMDKGRSIFG